MNLIKNLGDIIDINFIQRHALTQPEKRFFIFFKGKLYKYRNYDNNDKNCQMLNIKYCNIELLAI